ncbi:MAG: hypothetical protein HC840_12485 [Leptolyngbyaceae cyanobacterium RM2_2_4]|nr:hypothetical protein [Leptolyngbyaceae cyanobacterium SM1_4_3]NJN89576.1 hypothetical protein [Leptolyngbyaceae cyanobacterium SL_5_14]NJO50110.1 hypothetical protein [Leptolyngbyaceae cyanobacterium RM2_2_4]NJO67006.1 hypothetical protein [Leptolyngbyaceae cyanobacterium RM1_405_57]
MAAFRFPGDRPKSPKNAETLTLVSLSQLDIGNTRQRNLTRQTNLRRGLKDLIESYQTF